MSPRDAAIISHARPGSCRIPSGSKRDDIPGADGPRPPPLRETASVAVDFEPPAHRQHTDGGLLGQPGAWGVGGSF